MNIPKYIITIVFFVAVLGLPNFCHAKNTIWSQTHNVSLLYALHYGGTGWNLGLQNPNISIKYNVNVLNATTGKVLSDGATVMPGDALYLVFEPHASADIYWYGAGYSMDSPYGSWGNPEVSPSGFCSSQNYVGQYYGYCSYGIFGTTNFNYHIFIPLIVAPPPKNITFSSGLTCDADFTTDPVTGAYYKLCTVNSDFSGTITINFNFSSTYGKMWYAYAAGSSGEGCVPTNGPMRYWYGGCNYFYNQSSCNVCLGNYQPGDQFVLAVPSNTITYILNVPIINGACGTANKLYTSVPSPWTDTLCTSTGGIPKPAKPLFPTTSQKYYAAPSSVATSSFWYVGWNSTTIIAYQYNIDPTTGNLSGPIRSPSFSGTFGAGGIAVDKDGNAWITNLSSTSTNGIAKINPTTGAVIMSPATGFSYPYGVAVDANGYVWVTNWGTNTVLQLNSSGALVNSYSVSSYGYWPTGIATDADGNVWVTIPSTASSFNGIGNKVLKFTPPLTGTGPYTITSFTLTGATGPRGIAVDTNGNIWTANCGGGTDYFGSNCTSYSISKIPLVSGVYGAPVTYTAGLNLNRPWGIAIDFNNYLNISNMGDGKMIVLNSTPAYVGYYQINGGRGASFRSWNNGANGFPYDNNVFGDATGFALNYFVLGGSKSPQGATSPWVCAGATSANCSASLVIDGQCGPTVNNQYFQPEDVGNIYLSDLCSIGSYADLYYDETIAKYTWSCPGSNGGSPSDCQFYVVLDGQCGTAVNGDGTCLDGGSLCINSMPSQINSDGIIYSWTCAGINNGTNMDCSCDSGVMPVCSFFANNNQPYPEGTNPFDPNYVTACSVGYYSNLAASEPDQSLVYYNTGSQICSPGVNTRYDWDCNNGVGGSVHCSMTFPQPGRCGPSNGQTFTDLTVSSEGLCGTGAVNNFQLVGDQWNWQCMPISGGTTTATCSATRQSSGGVCGTANGGAYNTNILTAELCQSGTPVTQSGTSVATINDLGGGSLGPWIWYCKGSDGLWLTHSCSSAVNGECGTANSTFPASQASDKTLCACGNVGTVNWVEGEEGIVNWSCNGINGSTANCTATIQEDGACGPANGESFVVLDDTNEDLCLIGSVTSGSFQTTGGGWTWTCDSVNITPAVPSSVCSASLITDGQCGSSNGQTLSIKPASNLCSSGTPSTVLPASGPGPWSWTCSAPTSGGASVFCSAFVDTTAPQVGNMGKTAEDYENSGCGAGTIWLEWKYFERNPPGTNQSKYQIQIDDNSNFSSPEINRIVSNLSNPSGTVNKQAFTISGTTSNPIEGNLAFGKTYYWRVQVWDSQNPIKDSGWVLGPSFATLAHALPCPEIDCSVPTPPGTLTSGQTDCNDSSRCYDENNEPRACGTGGANANYNWSFGDGSTNTTQGAASHTYTVTGPNPTFDVTLEICEPGIGCGSVTETIQLRTYLSAPEWKEVSPF